MVTNTMVLIVVAALATLVLASVLALVAYKTRIGQRHGSGATARDQTDDALRLRHREALAAEFETRAHAAQVEIDIKTVRACTLQQQARAFRSEAVTSRDQLNEVRVHRLAG
ncbi:MAG TPA: hypothetical protein VHT50_15850 [Mycobacterium sp.]|jgi:hypothetical protein|nr:hypothetical protein [Mycobacterium sp.]